MHHPNGLLTRDELQTRWNLSRSTIIRLDRANQLRPIKTYPKGGRGLKVVYLLADILAIESTSLEE